MNELKQIGIDIEVNGAIENSRRSFKESPNDILRRLLLQGSSLAAPTLQVEPPPARLAGERVTGRWTVEIDGRRIAAANLKGAYRTLLLVLAERHPDFLHRFSEEQARSRRFVARAARDLYLTSPALAKKHAEPLVDGWFFDTNLSTDQVARRARIAARLCGLRYGEDVRLLNNLEEI
jgi:hypothetical protein